MGSAQPKNVFSSPQLPTPRSNCDSGVQNETHFLGFRWEVFSTVKAAIAERLGKTSKSAVNKDEDPIVAVLYVDLNEQHDMDQEVCRQLGVKTIEKSFLRLDNMSETLLNSINTDPTNYNIYRDVSEEIKQAENNSHQLVTGNPNEAVVVTNTNVKSTVPFQKNFGLKSIGQHDTTGPCLNQNMYNSCMDTKSRILCSKKQYLEKQNSTKLNCVANVNEGYKTVVCANERACVLPSRCAKVQKCQTTVSCSSFCNAKPKYQQCDGRCANVTYDNRTKNNIGDKNVRKRCLLGNTINNIQKSNTLVTSPLSPVQFSSHSLRYEELVPYNNIKNVCPITPPHGCMCNSEHDTYDIQLRIRNQSKKNVSQLCNSNISSIQSKRFAPSSPLSHSPINYALNSQINDQCSPMSSNEFLMVPLLNYKSQESKDKFDRRTQTGNYFYSCHTAPHSSARWARQKCCLEPLLSTACRYWKEKEAMCQRRLKLRKSKVMAHEPYAITKQNNSYNFHANVSGNLNQPIKSSSTMLSNPNKCTNYYSPGQFRKLSEYQPTCQYNNLSTQAKNWGQSKYHLSTILNHCCKQHIDLPYKISKHINFTSQNALNKKLKNNCGISYEKIPSRTTMIFSPREILNSQKNDLVHTCTFSENSDNVCRYKRKRKKTVCRPYHPELKFDKNSRVVSAQTTIGPTNRYLSNCKIHSSEFHKKRRILVHKIESGMYSDLTNETHCETELEDFLFSSSI